MDKALVPNIQANAVSIYKRIKFFHVLIPLIFIQISQFKIRDAEKSPVKPIAAVVMNSCHAFSSIKGIYGKLPLIINRIVIDALLPHIYHQ